MNQIRCPTENTCFGFSPATPPLTLKQLTSAVFTIDNTPPQIQVLSQAVQAKLATIKFKAFDSVSSLRRAETSIDGSEWETAFSVDGIVDSMMEEFEVRTEPLDAGEHTVALRVYDSTGNAAIGKAIVQIK